MFLTENGRGRFVVMDIEDYERDKALEMVREIYRVMNRYWDITRIFD